MPNALQEFLARATLKQREQLEAAIARLPEDKRAWSPMGDARTAVDQFTECAMLNGSTVEMLQTRSFPANFDFATYLEAKAALSQDWEKVQAMLKENTDRAIAAILAVPEADFNVEVQMPWGPLKLSDIMSYPYWNMSYHEGQINYIASMLGCLE